MTERDSLASRVTRVLDEEPYLESVHQAFDWMALTGRRLGTDAYELLKRGTETALGRSALFLLGFSKIDKEDS